MRVLLLGAPGAGKGTQGVRLAAHYGVEHLAAGDLLRAEVAGGTALGRAAQEYMARGDFVPDELIVEMMIERMAGSVGATGGYIVDGFPRTVTQALVTADAALERGVRADAAVYLVAADDVLVRRLLQRGQSGARADDTEEVIRHRLELFHDKTRPMVDYYRDQRGILVQVDADAPVDEVFRVTVERLDRMRPRTAAARRPDAAPAPAAAPASPVATPAPAVPAGADLGRSLGTDYFLLADELSEADRAVLRRTRQFVDEDVLPVINGYWERAEVPWDLIQRMGKLDIVGDGLEGYGCAQLSPLAAGLVNMELNRGDGSLGTFYGVQAGLAMRSIALLGSEEQKARWLPGMARLETIGAFALTEPRHGSDAVALETTARRDGDSYVIDGEKRWIGNGSISDVAVVWARDADDGEVKGFLVEKGMPGYEGRVIEHKLSVRAIWQADVTLRGLRVPAANLLPGARSFRDAGRVLAATRGAVAWGALGHAVAAYEAALSYCRQRHQFGRPLASFQLVQDQLVKMLAEVTAMQLYCVQLARLTEAGTITDTIAALAKMNNTLKAREVIAQARDLLGGNGILLDYHVARHQADIEAIYTYEGTEHIQTLIVGRDITGISAFT